MKVHIDDLAPDVMSDEGYVLESQPRDQAVHVFRHVRFSFAGGGISEALTEMVIHSKIAFAQYKQLSII